MLYIILLLFSLIAGVYFIFKYTKTKQKKHLIIGVILILLIVAFIFYIIYLAVILPRISAPPGSAPSETPLIMF